MDRGLGNQVDQYAHVQADDTKVPEPKDNILGDAHLLQHPTAVEVWTVKEADESFPASAVWGRRRCRLQNELACGSLRLRHVPQVLPCGEHN